MYYIKKIDMYLDMLYTMYVIIYEPIGSIVLWCIIQQNKTTSVAETVSFDLETHLFISDVKFFIVVDL